MMKNKAIVFLITACALSSLNMVAQKKNALITDLNYAYETILKYHPKFQNEEDSARISATRDSLQNQFADNRTMQPKEIVGALLRSVQDGHTGLTKSKEAKFLPFEMGYEEGEYRIIKSYKNYFKKGDVILN